MLHRSRMFLPRCILLAAAWATLTACSTILPPATATPTPIPTFGMKELEAVFADLPQRYVQVEPSSRQLGSANFNDFFDNQIAFRDSLELWPRSKGFSVSLGILDPASQSKFDYALEKTYGTADAELIRTQRVDRAHGVFWLDVGDIALGSRHLEKSDRPAAAELRETITFRRGEVGVVVKFAQQASKPSGGGLGLSPFKTPEDVIEILMKAQCWNVYTCYDSEPDFVTGPQAARMIDEAIVQFYDVMPHPAGTFTTER